MRKRVLLSFIVSSVIVLGFIISSLIKPSFGAYTSLFRWLLILILLISNSSILELVKSRKWSFKEWFSWLTYLVINVFIILLILRADNIIIRTIAFLFLLISILLLSSEEKRRVGEVEKEARILESAQEKLDKYLKELSRAKEELKRQEHKIGEKRQRRERVFSSKNGRVYHKKGCVVGERISRKNRVYYDSEEEARKKGLKPCKVCFG